MSSVLIKGMEMPKNCEECDFCHWSNLHQTGRCDRCDDEPVCADFGTDYKRTRARFCPLVEVSTPHGRLIDADELKKEYPHDADWEYPVSTNEYVNESIDNAPTVVEAEGEEHE